MKITIALQKKPYDIGFLTKLYVKAIQVWTRSEYFHSEIIFNNKRISAYPQRGVDIHYFDNDYDFEHFDYYKIEVLEPTGAQEMLIWEYINEQTGTGYDWKGIFFSQVFKLGVNNPTEWFCSEIVTKILQLLLYEQVLDCLPNKVSPAKLYRLIKDYAVKLKRVNYATQRF